MNYEKISKNLNITSEDETAVLKVGMNFEKLTRFEAIKLRNYLNKFINGDLEEDYNDNEDILSKL